MEHFSHQGTKNVNNCSKPELRSGRSEVLENLRRENDARPPRKKQKTQLKTSSKPTPASPNPQKKKTGQDGPGHERGALRHYLFVGKRQDRATLAEGRILFLD